MEEKVYITDLIEVSVLQKVQDAFSSGTGMAALIIDEKGSPITNGSNFTDYCMKYTRCSKVGKARCEQCDKYGALITTDTGEPAFYECHSGLIDFAAPIIAGGEMIGGFIGGQILQEPANPERIRKVAEEIGVDFDEYWAALQKVRIVKKESIDRAADFVFTIANVLSDMAMGKYMAVKAGKEIARSAKMKSDFLANMSHEIRTPMNAIIGMAEMTLRQQISDEARNYVNQIKSASHSLLTIINDILDFSKIESGRLDIIPAEYDPFSLFNDTASILKSRLGDKNIFLDFDISPNVPSLLYGDSVRIKQVLINLSNNAIKFTKEGFVRIGVDFERLDAETIMLEVKVEDTGIGIRKEDLEHIFDAFQQVDAYRSRMVEGSGLGLSIVKSLVSLMGGDVFIESEYGRGSTFSFKVPQTIAKDEKAFVLKTDTPKIAFGIFKNEFLRKTFVRDCEKLGVKSFVLFENANISTVYDAMQNISEQSEFFLFFEKSCFSDDIGNFVSSNENIVSIEVLENESSVAEKIPNLKKTYTPLSVMNLSLLFNKENPLQKTTQDNNDFYDFTAPDAKILIVDDNSVNLAVAEGLMQPLGMQIETAKSGSEALEKVSKNGYDIIFMDHMMPEMDGIETTHKIRTELPNASSTTIIALTANATLEAQNLFLREGMTDFVPKPIEINVLVEKIRKYLPPEKIVKYKENDDEKQNLQGAHDKNENKFDMLSDIDIDIPYSLNLLGNEKLFDVVLKEYYRSLPSKASSIQSHFENKDWNNFTIEVHALKSASRQIGLLTLADMAESLEKAGKSGDIDFILANTDSLLKKYCSYETVFEKYFASTEKSVPSTSAKKPFERDSVFGFLQKILEACENLDIDGINQSLSQLDNFDLPENQRDILKKMHDYCEDVDMDLCSQAVQEWKNLL